MLNIEVINNIKRLESLRMAWNEALSRSEFDDVQLTWEWLYAWSSNFAKDSLFILAVWDKDRILAIAPLMKKTYRYLGLPVRSIKGLRNEYTMHFDFILTERAEECLELIFRRLGEETWDFIEFGEVFSSSRTIRLLDGAAGKNRFFLRRGNINHGCPYILTQKDWRAYYGSLSKKFRSEVNSKEKRLSRLGGLSLAEAKKADDEVLESFFRIESMAWKEKAGTAIRCLADAKGFYSDLARLAGQNGWLSIYFLKAGGREIACDYALRYRGAINILKIGYDTEYARYSPGVLLKKKILEAVSGNGVHKLDLQGYCEPWKMRWTSRSREFTPIWVCRKAAYPLIVYYLLFGAEIFLKRCASRVKAKRKYVHDRKDSRI